MDYELDEFGMKKTPTFTNKIRKRKRMRKTKALLVFAFQCPYCEEFNSWEDFFLKWEDMMKNTLIGRDKEVEEKCEHCQKMVRVNRD